MRRRIALPSLPTLLAIGFLAGGCASQPSGEEPAADGGRVCVSVRTINSFSPLSDQEVLVTAGVNNRYLFTVTGVCQGLRSANRIAVADQTGSICNDNFGRIVFRDFAMGPQSCRVGNIEPVASREAAREIVSARQAARRGN